MRARLALLALLTACASGGAAERERAARPLLSDTQAPDPGPLGVAQVPSGRCGTVLWTKSGADQVPIFRSVDDGTASMVIDGQVVALTLTGRAGEARVGIPAVQTFTGETGAGPINVAMRGVWGQAFPAGSYVARATISATGADGWSRVLPAAGIAGCRP